MKLEIGGGSSPKKGYINIDMCDSEKVDYKVDLNNDRFPFEDNSVEEIVSFHCLEHLNPGYAGFLNCLEEMYRVSKPNAKWFILVPYYLTSKDNPYHTNLIFSEHTFYFFSDEGCPYYHTRARRSSANESTEVNLKVDSVNLFYYENFAYVAQMPAEKQFEIRHTLNNVVKEINYNLTVIK